MIDDGILNGETSVGPAGSRPTTAIRVVRIGRKSGYCREDVSSRRRPNQAELAATPGHGAYVSRDEVRIVGKRSCGAG